MWAWKRVPETSSVSRDRIFPGWGLLLVLPRITLFPNVGCHFVSGPVTWGLFLLHACTLHADLKQDFSWFELPLPDYALELLVLVLPCSASFRLSVLGQ